MDLFINGIHQVRLCIGISVRKKNTSLFLWSGITLNYTFSRFCENKLARALIYIGNGHDLYK